jgi:hypothetical protein
MLCGKSALQENPGFHSQHGGTAKAQNPLIFLFGRTGDGASGLEHVEALCFLRKVLSPK